MLSIIMPVYNTGKDLDESIPSILSQTYKNFELICVDDCSTDLLTKERLNYYEQSDEKITLICLEKNKGAAEARNIGFTYATGDYVMFLDADDRFAPNMLETLYDTIVKEQADVCVCNFEVHKENEFIKKARHYSISEISFALKDFEEEDALLYFMNFPWNKMVRREFLVEKDIWFQSLTSGNDIYFSCMVLCLANKITYPDTKGLIEWKDLQSEKRVSVNNNPINLYLAFQKSLDRINSEKKPELLKYLLVMLLHTGILELNRSKNEENNRKFYQYIQSYFMNFFGKIEFKNNIYNQLADYYLNNSYESYWWKQANSFEWQLERNQEKIIKIISKHKNILLWGLGKRGMAFLRFCKQNKIILYGVADKKNDRVGELCEEEYLIRHTDDAIIKADYIIASNGIIWKDLCKNVVNIEIMNLEEFCPY